MVRAPKGRAGARLRVVTTLLLATALLGSPGARAIAAPKGQPSTKVVLFTPAGSDPLVARLEAELLAVGIAVQKVVTPVDGQVETAVSRAIAAGASAAIRVIPRARGVDVWTGDTTARMSRRRSVASESSDLSVIALRTVEFLRATLLDVKQSPSATAVPRGEPSGQPEGEPVPAREAAPSDPGGTVEGRTTNDRGPPPPTETPAPPPGTGASGRAESPASTAGAQSATPRPAEAPPEVTAPPVTVARKTERLPEWGLEPPPELGAPREPLHLELAAGPSFVLSPGGVGAITAVAAFGRARMSSVSGFELMAVIPLAPALLHNAEGTVEVKATLLGAAVTFRAEAPRRLRADAAVGASAVMMRAAGSATDVVDATTAPNVGSIQTSWRMAAHLRLGGGVDLSRWLCLRADVIGGLTARTTIGYDVTTVAGRTITTDRATWGPAFATATLGLQASW